MLGEMDGVGFSCPRLYLILPYTLCLFGFMLKLFFMENITRGFKLPSQVFAVAVKFYNITIIPS